MWCGGSWCRPPRQTPKGYYGSSPVTEKEVQMLAPGRLQRRAVLVTRHDLDCDKMSVVIVYIERTGLSHLRSGLSRMAGSAVEPAAPRALFGFRVPLRMGLAPRPGRTDDAFQIGEPGLPAQLFFDSFRARHQHRWIARTPWRFLCRYRMARQSTHRFDYLADAEALPIAEVVDQRIFFCERLENQKMGLGQIAYVDVIADAGAVRSRIVGSKNGQLFAGALRHL